MFGYIILDVIERKHEIFKREHKESDLKLVPLEDIKIESNNFTEYYIEDMQEIAKLQAKPNHALEPIASYTH